MSSRNRTLLAGGNVTKTKKKKKITKPSDSKICVSLLLEEESGPDLYLLGRLQEEKRCCETLNLQRNQGYNIVADSSLFIQKMYFAKCILYYII